MKKNWMILFVGLVVLTMIPLIGYQSAVAAPPTGEVKTVAPNWGHGVPIPFFEIAMANDWIFLLYDFLVGRTPEGQLETETGVASRWEKSPDALSWTFYLRKGIRFHDGVELTAKDVKFSLEQLMVPGVLPDGAPTLRRDVKNIEVKDPYTVVIHLKQPNIFLPNILRDGTLTGQILPKDYYEKVGKDEFAKHPIGSGPYKWHSQMQGSFVKLEATEKHWRDGVPKYKYMTFLIIPEEGTRIAMLRTGEADISRVSRDGVKEALNGGLNVLTRGNVQVLVFQPNMQWTSRVFSDIRFRKALNLAIDREAISKQLFADMAKPVATFCGSNIATYGSDLLALKPYPYDPQEAKRLVKEGGWEGYEFGLISYPRPSCPEYPQVVEAVAGFWEKMGLKPKIRMSDWNVWRTARREGKTQNTIDGFDTFPEMDLYALTSRLEERWHGKGAAPIVNIPELNEKFERISRSKDTAEISRIMAEVNRYAYDHYLLLPICEFSEKVATTKRIPKWNMGGRQNDRNYNDLIRQR